MDSTQLLTQLVQRFDTALEYYMGVDEPELPAVWATSTDPSALQLVYNKISLRFPALYEQLLLTYRWLRADADLVSFWANPPGPGLDNFASEYFRDEFLVSFCLSKGFLPFGACASGSYDPVCFDCNRGSNSSRPIVRLCHESILLKQRISVVSALYPSFESLILHCIESSSSVQLD